MKAFIFVVLSTIFLCLGGCVGDSPAPRDGTQASKAVKDEARSEALKDSSVKAGIDAAKADAEAKIAEEKALRTKVKSDIDAAVDARSKAIVAQAVADAEHKASADADAQAEQSIKKSAAADELLKKQHDEQARKDRAWWIAAIATASAAFIAFALLSVEAPSRFQALPAGIVIAAWSLYAFAQWATVIAAIVGGCILVALAVVIVLVMRQVIKVEWPDAVSRLRATIPSAAEAHDVASKARQSPWVRKVIDWFFKTKEMVKKDLKL